MIATVAMNNKSNAWKKQASAKRLRVRQLIAGPSTRMRLGDSSEDTKESAAAKVLQRAVRNKAIANQHMHRHNLAERLLFESSVVWETARFLNQVLVFALLLGALRLSSDEAQKRGIFENLQDTFEFDRLKDIKSRQEFVEALPGLTTAANDYFLLSSEYFESSGAGSKQLIRDVVEFRTPVSAGPFTLSGTRFSFTAWIRTGASFLKGYILQKPSGEDLMCWGWAHGPGLHYGGHDFFPADDQFPPQQGGVQERQKEVGVEHGASFASGRFELLTVAVDESEVSFWLNTLRLGTSRLLAPLSDCFNSHGVLTGDEGLEIGDLRYHPTVLTEVEIEELWFNGGSLADLSTGSRPEAHTISDLEALDDAVTSSLDSLHSLQSSRHAGTDINFVVDRLLAPADFHSAPATGTTIASPSPVFHQALGREYHSLYSGPGRLTRTESQHRYIRGQPNFVGTGATLAFWYRHRVCADPNDACGLYLLAAYEEPDDSFDKCWSLWIEKSKIWYDNPKATDGNAKNQYPAFDIPDKIHLNGDKAWRHVAMVFTEQTDEIELYLDGTLAAREIWGGPVSSTASCASANPRISFGHQDPGYTYGAEAEVHDLRMYIHGDKGALQPHEILTLATETTSELSDDYKCLESTDAAFEEKEWLDMYGHDCSWYGEHAKELPAVCNMPNAAQMCPISCSSRQECWRNATAVNAFYSWTGIKRVEPGSDSLSGAVCLGAGRSADHVVRECQQWVADGVPDDVLASDWYQSFKQEGGTEDRRGRRLDLRDCEQLARAVQGDCRLNESAIRAFTSESQANNGDFTIYFWTRPLGEAAINQHSGTFIPHLQFLSSLSPPTHNLAIGLWANPNGEARLYSACDEAKFENLEFTSASSDDWTFFAITSKQRRNTTEEQAVGEGATLTNVAKRDEKSVWKSRQCLFNPEQFFVALEVNYPVLMSPIAMIPDAVPHSSLQRYYLSSLAEMRSKSGAASGLFAGIEIEKRTFAAPMILVAPPMMFQTRAHPAEACPSSFGEHILETQHTQMLKTKCASPYVCDEQVTSNPALLLACAGDAFEHETQFGLPASGFTDQGSSVRGYADFLASVTEPVFLFRDGTLFETKDFIDTLTQVVQVLFVFWNPEASITTVLTVRADLVSTSSANVEVSVDHYELLEGEQLTIYTAVQILVLVNVAIMFIEVAMNLKSAVFRVIGERRLEAEELAELKRSSSKLEEESAERTTITMRVAAVASVLRDMFKSVRELFIDILDCIIAVLVIVCVARRLPTKVVSASKTNDIVGALGQIEWSSNQIPRADKVTSFFDAMNELMDTIRGESELNAFCNIVLILSLLRLIKCTSMHPRLHLLGGTLRKAWDDLWHAAILILLLMLCFAGIGTWRFGEQREDFGDLEATCQTLFMMTFGEFPEGWTDSRDLQLFTVLYIMLVFLLVQNFLLAVIVEAYMDVRKDNEELQTEQEFVLDVCSSFQAHWLAYRKGWPTPFKLGSEIDLWSARHSVRFNDLWNTGMFRSRESVSAFVKHYRTYEFLEPERFDEYGPEIKDEKEKLTHDLEIRLGKVMGLNVQTLREFADAQLKIASDRRQARLPAPTFVPPAPAAAKQAPTDEETAAQHSAEEVTEAVPETLPTLPETLKFSAGPTSDSCPGSPVAASLGFLSRRGLWTGHPLKDDQEKDGK